MSRILMLITFALLICGFRTPSYSAQQLLEGNWVGEFKLNNESTFIKVSFKPDKLGAQATADLPPFGPKGLALTQISIESSRVHFELLIGARKLAFNGELKNDAISGEIRQKEAIAYYKLNDDFTRTGEGWERLQEAYQKAKARNAEWLLEEPQPKDFWFRQFYRRVMDFDPVPHWEKVTCPVLAFFGELDRQVPPEANKIILGKALKGASNKDYTIIVLPKANHLFLRAETGTRTEYPYLKNFVTGYFDTMVNWLLKRIDTKR